MNEFQRLELQIGQENLQKLYSARVAIFGLGGVGGFVAESLVRSGIGNFTIIDKDIVDITNINRQIIATHSSIGKPKIEVFKDRILDINPNAKVTEIQAYFGKDNIDLDFTQFDYIIDAVDDINAKIEIIRQAKLNNVPVISAMGAGNKFDPLKLRVCDISMTNTCPLAKIMRQKLQELGISGVKCVFSIEKPIKIEEKTISSNAFVPSVAGILIAREVVFDLIK